MSSFGTHQFAPVRTYEELTRQPGYISRFDPSDDKVEAVLYHYVFVIQCQCGILSCGKHHNEGFVVKLESGLISQVGHCCWKKKYEEIGEILNRFQEQQETPRLVSELLRHKAACVTHRSYITKLTAELQPLVERKHNFKVLFPLLFAELESKAEHGGQYQVIKVTELIKEEAMSKPESARRSDDYTYSHETIAVVRGCEFIRTSALVLLLEAEKIVEMVERANMVDTSFSKLYATTIAASNIDSYILKAQALLAAGKQLLSQDSVEAIRRIQGSQAIEKEARRFELSKLDVGRTYIRNETSTKKMNRAQRRANAGWRR